jgi:hypothetical protein
MPVTGLPASLETILDTLLQDNNLTSYKIESQGSKTFVVLRLVSTADGHNYPNMAENNNTTHTVAAYKRKGPSQLARDRKRAEAHRERQQQVQASDIHVQTLPKNSMARLNKNIETNNDDVGLLRGGADVVEGATAHIPDGDNARETRRQFNQGQPSSRSARPKTDMHRRQEKTVSFASGASV